MGPVQPGEQEGPGRGAAGEGMPGPAEPSSRPAPDDDALHPVRYLRRNRGAREAGRPGSWSPPAAAGGGRRSSGEAAGVEMVPGAARPSGAGTPTGGSRRRTLLAVLGLALIVAAGSTSVALLEQSHPATLPTPSAIPAVPAADAIGDLRMYSQSTGWARRLSDGTILHTTGGMGHWTVASPPPNGHLLAVTPVGPEAARALIAPSGAMGRATAETWITQDGGSVWSQGGSLGMQGFNVAVGGTLDFLDAEHGWFSQIEAAGGVAGTALFRTVDGGESWTEMASSAEGAPGSAGVIPDGCDDLTAAFVSVSTGFMTGTCLTGAPPLYVTRDGGLTWSVAPLSGLPAGIAAGTSFPPQFTSGQSGTLLTESQTDNATTTSLFATTDGGLAWGLRWTSAGSPVATDFLDADHGWLVTDEYGNFGTAAELYSTQDGGSAWTRVNAFPFEGIGLDFLTTEFGWAAPASSAPESGPTYVVQTTDGGRSWTAALPRIAGPSPSP